MRSLLRICILLLAVSLTGSQLKAQKELLDILKAGENDAKLLLQSYVEPFGGMLGSSINGGWYNTGKPHKKLGFDITITTSMAMASSSSKTFDIAKLPLSTLQVKSGSSSIASTVAGNGEAVTLVSKETGLDVLTLKGANLPMVPMPALNVGVGLPFDIEIRGRYLPTVEVGDVGKTGLWGVGLKKGLKDMIPGGALIPFQLTLMAGYTQYNLEYNFPDVDNQTMELKSKAYTGQLLISKSIPVLTVYAGAGYSSATTDFSLIGDFSGYSIGNYSFELAKVNGFQYSVGARIKLAVLTFHFDYTKSEFPVYTGGVGISFR